MKIFKLIPILVLIGVVVMWSGAVYAEDTDTSTNVISLTIAETAQLGVTSGAITEAVTTDALSGSAESYYDLGEYTFTTQPVLNVDANKKWRLSVSIGAWTLPSGYAGNKTTIATSSDLKLAVSAGVHRTGFSTATLLDGTDQEIAKHTGGVSNEVYTCTYTVLLRWTEDIPGTYLISATYTLATKGA